MNRSDLKNIDTRNETASSRNSRRWISFFSHFIGLTLLFLLPDVIITLHHDELFFIPTEMYIKAAVFASVFYINYYIIIRHTLLPRPRPALFLLYNVLLTAFALLCLYITWSHIDPGAKPSPPGHSAPPGDPLVVLARDFIIIVLTIGFSAALQFNNYREKMDLDRREIESLRREMELAQLRSQLNPHFLFNTLNSIYALIDIDRNKAKEAVHTLSKLLRHVLYECKGNVSIRQECEFLAHYVDLMKMRLPADFPVAVKLDCSANPNLTIPPLLFINIVENTFKYGMKAAGKRLIDISLTIGGNTVSCRCRNAYNPSTHAETADASGIGLRNLRRRLDLRYPGCYTLDIADSGSEFSISLTIDFSGNNGQKSIPAS